MTKPTNKELIDKHRELWQRRHDGIVAKAPEDDYRWIEALCMDSSLIMADRLEAKIAEVEELLELAHQMDTNLNFGNMYSESEAKLTEANALLDRGAKLLSHRKDCTIGTQEPQGHYCSCGVSDWLQDLTKAKQA